jgi:GMP synthase (glutamine-hydrolysing)
MFIPEKFIGDLVEEMRRNLGGGKVLIAVTGGVDSTVCAVLTHRAIGDQMVPVVIDDGLIRKDELERVTEFLEASDMHVRPVDASKEFYDALHGNTELGEQRKVYQNAFYAVLGRVVREEKADYLVRSTTAADVVRTEEGVEIEDDIFEQVGIINPRSYGVTIIEPLKVLYKHEVRMVARSLELPPELSGHRSFPVVLDMLRDSLVK